LGAVGDRRSRMAAFERHITKRLQQRQEGHPRVGHVLNASDSEPDILIGHEIRLIDVI
jgi:hypothetical protein